MPSLNVVSNFDQVIKLVAERIESIDIKKMTSLQASTAMASVRKRVHVDGKDSNNNDIGKYSAGYLKVRSGVYSDSKPLKKGSKAVKSAGSFSKGKSKGSQRPKYQRGTDPKVILSLTRQMESDMILIPLENGCGIGYSNVDNFKKSQYNEKTYRKKIFSLTKNEISTIYEVGQEFINNELK